MSMPYPQGLDVLFHTKWNDARSFGESISEEVKKMKFDFCCSCRPTQAPITASGAVRPLVRLFKSSNNDSLHRQVISQWCDLMLSLAKEGSNCPKDGRVSCRKDNNIPVV